MTTNRKEELDDCTHTAPKGEFKAMTKKEEFEKQIEYKKIIAVPLTYLEDHAIKEHKYEDEMLFKDEVVKLLKQAEFKGIKQTEEKTADFIKELKEYLRKLDDIERIKPYFPIIKKIDTLTIKHFGDKLIEKQEVGQ